MNELFQENKEFKGVNYVESPLEKGVYEQCSFLKCVFNNVDLSGIVFLECEFDECDLTMANLKGATLQEVSFVGCKLMGLHFEQCKPLLFSVSFKKCDLKLASFSGCSLKRSSFAESAMTETDFTEADMAGITVRACDLSGAIFDHTVLEGADLRHSFNFSINPETNRLKKTRFSAEAISGLLDTYDIIIN